MGFLERVLIVTASPKAGEMLSQLLASFSRPESIVTVPNCAEARRILPESQYELVIINTPLPDEFGHDFSMSVAQDTNAGVLLIAKAEIADEVASRVESTGVLVVPKPLNRASVFQVLRLLTATRKRLLRLEKENAKLQRQLDDMRLISRAKCLLIEFRGMTEPEAHSYIEQSAMNHRMTKRQIAQMIVDGASDAE